MGKSNDMPLILTVVDSESQYPHTNFPHLSPCIVCEQALWASLAAGWEKEGELATMSLEFEYLHRKSLCEMLIGGDDISNDVITLGMCFSMFVETFTLK